MWGSGLHSAAKRKGLPIFGVQMLGDCFCPLPGSGLGTLLRSSAEKPPHDNLNLLSKRTQLLQGVEGTHESRTGWGGGAVLSQSSKMLFLVWVPG